MTKKIVTAIILFISLVTASFAGLGDLGPSLSIVKSNIDSDNIKPGNNFGISFNILNSGDEMSRDVDIKIEKNDMFELIGKDQSNDLKYICSDCSYDATYYFKVNPNIKSGIYPITFDIYHDNNQITTNTIDVKVEGTPDIIILNDNLNDLKVAPNDEFNLNFDVKNVGTSDAIKCKISSKDKSIINEGSEVVFIKEIPINSLIKMNYNFLVSEDLNPGLYKIPFEISCENDNGNIYNNEINLGIEVLNRAKLDVQYLKLNSYSLNLFKEFEITGMLENIGYGEAKNIYVVANTDLSGYKKSFVGTLDRNEDSPIQFKLKADKEGKQDINLEIHYTDDFGEHVMNEKLQVEVTKPTNQLYTIFGIVLLIVVLFFGRKLLKKKN